MCLQKTRKIGEHAMEKFGTLDSEKTMAIPGDRWWPQTAKQEGEKTSETLRCNIWEKT